MTVPYFPCEEWRQLWLLQIHYWLKETSLLDRVRVKFPDELEKEIEAAPKYENKVFKQEELPAELFR